MRRYTKLFLDLDSATRNFTPRFNMRSVGGIPRTEKVSFFRDQDTNLINVCAYNISIVKVCNNMA